MNITYLMLILLLANCSPGEEPKLTGRDVRLFRDTPVWEAALAIRDNQPEKLRQLLQGEPLLVLNYQEQHYGQSLLNWAVYRDSYASAKVLATLGADPNLKAYDSTSAFINAADKHDDTSYLRLLLKHGGDVHAVADREGSHRLRTPLIAAASNSLAGVKLLISAGADADYVRSTKRTGMPGENVESALISALRTDKIETAHYLLMDVGVAFDYVFNTTIEGKPLDILYYLRHMTFPLNSQEYQLKMEVVDFLKARGIDYSRAAVPATYYKNYDKAYLEKY